MESVNGGVVERQIVVVNDEPEVVVVGGVGLTVRILVDKVCELLYLRVGVGIGNEGEDGVQACSEQHIEEGEHLETTAIVLHIGVGTE